MIKNIAFSFALVTTVAMRAMQEEPSFKFDKYKLLQKAVLDDKEYFNDILSDEHRKQALHQYLEGISQTDPRYVPYVTTAMKLIGGTVITCGMSLLGFGIWNYTESEKYISHKIHLAIEELGGIIALLVGYRLITTTKEDVEASLPEEEQKIRFVQKYIAALGNK